MTTPLDGYKTYLVAVAVIGTAIFFYMRGEIDAPSSITMILGALGMGALRHAQK